MMNKPIFDDYVTGLDSLSGFDLYRIFGMIQEKLLDPQKQLEYITKLRIGMPVDYLNVKTHELRRGEVVQILQQFVVVKDSLNELLFKMPPYMLRTTDNDFSESSSKPQPRKTAVKKPIAKKNTGKPKAFKSPATATVPVTGSSSLPATPHVGLHENQAPSNPSVQSNPTPTQTVTSYAPSAQGIKQP